ncbi:MAG: hypothetical protein JWQ41_1739 [Variovorax sp.]|nr:hypothetical protein [Variovorax sp.]
MLSAEQRLLIELLAVLALPVVSFFAERLPCTPDFSAGLSGIDGKYMTRKDHMLDEVDDLAATAPSTSISPVLLQRSKWLSRPLTVAPESHPLIPGIDHPAQPDAICSCGSRQRIRSGQDRIRATPESGAIRSTLAVRHPGRRNLPSTHLPSGARSQDAPDRSTRKAPARESARRRGGASKGA